MTGFILDYTLRNVVLGAAILGIVGGALGTFALLRRQSLLGDALAHSALPGICIIFMLTGTKEPEIILFGAAISGWIGALALLGIVRSTRISEDAALGTVLTVFFGFGILLLTRIQKGDNANQSGLDRYLFGQAATLLERDVLVMGVLAVIALGLLALFYKEFKLLAFDPVYAASLGFPTVVLDVLLTSLIVVAVLIGLQTVGVVLMVAMLIAPAAAARQWTDRLAGMIGLSGLFGAIAGIAGSVVSSIGARIPTGPVIVLVATGILFVSMLVAPRRGIIWAWLRRRRQRARLARMHVLAEVHATVIASRLGDRAPIAVAGEGDPSTVSSLVGAVVDLEAIARSRGHSIDELRRGLAALGRQGLVSRGSNGEFILTAAGADAAERAAREQRLWQAHLAQQLDLSVDEVHLDVGDIERALPPEVVLQLERQTAPGESSQQGVREWHPS